MGFHPQETVTPKFPPHHGTDIDNPILSDTIIGKEFTPHEWNELFGDRPWVYVRPSDGEITKVYRSYTDYCED